MLSSPLVERQSPRTFSRYSTFSICGDPASVARQVRELREEVGGFGGLVSLAIEFGDRRRILDSISLLSHEVRPLLAA